MKKKPTTSSLLRDNDKALYQPWRNDAFLADEFVQSMTAIQRWMYRTLLQAAFTCSERPYLPDDDTRLWAMAGCENPKQWSQNKAVIRARFTPSIHDGQKLLGQKKVLEDWARIQEVRTAATEHARKAGLASAAKRQSKSTRVEPELNPSQREFNPIQPREVKGSEVKGSEVNLPSIPPPLEDGGQDGHPSEPTPNTNGTGKGKPAVLKFEDMQAVWTEYRDKENAEISIGLPRSGFEKLLEKLRASDSLARVADIKRAFRTWLEDRYLPAQGEWNEINSPLSVFADDAVHYITVLEEREPLKL
ncbi:MAG TPA: hypothetical protein VGT24_13170 [Candidatus Acidoferrales bacterium]|nr:hypothetical protein [Candidatus Acidoferrales bacterium]